MPEYLTVSEFSRILEMTADDPERDIAIYADRGEFVPSVTFSTGKHFLPRTTRGAVRTWASLDRLHDVFRDSGVSAYRVVYAPWTAVAGQRALDM